MTKTAYRKTEPNRAAIYARVSDKSQDAEDKTSISEQISDMETHLPAQGADYRRPLPGGGQRMVEEAPGVPEDAGRRRQGRFDTIVCWKSDRLSRGMYPAAALMEVVEAHRINLQAVMDAIATKTFGLMAAVGKIELDNFRERSSMGKRGTAKQGPHPNQQRSLRLPHRRGRSRRSWKPMPRWCAASTGCTSAMERERPPLPGS